MFGTYPKRYDLVLAGASTCRRNAHTVIVTEGVVESPTDPPPGHNTSGIERWFQYPNGTYGLPGNTKCIAALRIANATFPDARWFLYGDDDTMWFVDKYKVNSGENVLVLQGGRFHDPDDERFEFMKLYTREILQFNRHVTLQFSDALMPPIAALP